MVSKVWKHFSKRQDDVRCLICGKCLKRGDSSTKCLWSHLRVHPSTLLALKMEQKKEKLTSEEDPVGEQCSSQSLSGPLARSFYERTLRNREADENLDCLIAKFLAYENVPFCAVESQPFQEIIHRGFPSYELKTRKYYCDAVIPKMAEDLLNPVVAMLRKETFAITCDEWSKSSVSLLSMTAHMTNGTNDKRLNAVLSACPFNDVDHNSLNTSARILTILSQRGLHRDQVCCIVRDDASYMKNACSELLIDSFQCLAHLLHLFIYCISIFSQVNVASALSKCRCIATHFNHSSRARDILRKIQISRNLPQRCIPQDICTRWNSSCYLIAAVVEQRTALAEYLQSQISAKKPMVSHIPEITSEEVQLMERLHRILVLIRKESEKLCNENATASVYLPTLHAIQSYLTKIIDKSRNGFIRGTIQSMLADITLRFDKVSKCRILRIATLCDPRFKYMSQLFSDAEWLDIESTLIDYAVKWHSKAVLNCAAESSSAPCCSTETHAMEFENSDDENSVHPNNSEIQESISERSSSFDEDTLWPSQASASRPSSRFAGSETEGTELTDYMDALKFELSQYKRTANLERTDDVFGWLVQSKKRFPHFAVIASHMLSIPPTSVASERLFSKAGLLFGNKLRNRLSAEKAEHLLLVKANRKSISRAMGPPRDESVDCNDDIYGDVEIL